MTTLIFGKKTIAFCPVDNMITGAKGVGFTVTTSPETIPKFTNSDVYFEFPDRATYLSFLDQLAGFADHFKE